MTQRLELVLQHPGGTAWRVPVELSADRPAYVIGVGQGCDLRLEDPALADEHCRLVWQGGAVGVENLDATRITLCNDRAVSATTPLHDGDTLRLGQSTLRVEFRRAAEAAGSPGSGINPAGAGMSTPSQRSPTTPLASPFARPASPFGAPPRSGTGSRSGASPSPAGESPFRSVDAFVDRAMRELSEQYPVQAGRRTRRELQALIERGRERAKHYGFLDEEHILDFLRCVLLLDNELASPSGEAADVYYTLTVPNKPPEQRIKRALTMAQRRAEQKLGGSSSGPRTPSGSSRPGMTPTGVTPAGSAVPTAPSARPTTPSAMPTTPPGGPQVEMPTIQPVSASPPGLGTPVMSPPSAAHRRPPHTAPVPTMEADAQVTRATPPPEPARFSRRLAADEELPEIEGFRIIEKIASGGMGTVWRAHDLRLDIEVAIKVLRSMHPAAQQQFLLEARAAARLQHPNIIPVLRYEQYGQGGYCVMQLIRGKDAHKLIRLFGEREAHLLDAETLLEIAGLEATHLSPELRAASRGDRPYYRFVATWLAGVADGLERAHNENIVHYDVKPSNMLLSFDGRMMLGDFGLATVADNHQSDSAACVGTPGYLAPEMLAAWASRTGTQSTDHRVDVWGLGLTLYEFLTFKPAFDGSMAKVLRDIATSDPMPPRDVVWHTPPELDRICLKAIARNPDDRYQHAGHLADDLRDWLDGKSENGDRGSKGPLSWLRRPR